MIRRKILSLFIALLPLIGLSQALVINEFMSSNKSTLQDADGDYPDWIELYNNSDHAIDLYNYSLSDDVNKVRKWKFPSIEIQAKEYLVLFASGKDTTYGKEAHTNFKVSRKGENLILSNDSAEVLHMIPSHKVPADFALSCIPDGNIDRMMISFSSPGKSNKDGIRVDASHPSSYYSKSIELELKSINNKCQIYYTQNGAIPDTNSQPYTQVISLGPSALLPDGICLIPTTPLEGPKRLKGFKWKLPKNVNKSHVIRFAAFENGQRVSPISTKTYFIDDKEEDRYSFPVLSLVTDSLNLYQHDTGIYTPGKQYEEFGWKTPWLPAGNYLERGRLWERNAHVSFFETNGDLIFETDAGMRMRGQGSSVSPQKSFGLYFRSEYGSSKVKHRIFADAKIDTYKRLVMRNSGNDFSRTHFRDGLLMDLLKPMNLELQNFRPSILFINGEYWGIHGIREKYDAHYFKYHFDIEKDNINILNFIFQEEEGSGDDFEEIYIYVKNNDMSSPESYAYVDEKVDIPNMIDFLIAEIYFANHDWPCNNYKKWKTNEEGSKWRFLIYDLDFSFGVSGNSSWDEPSFIHALTDGNSWPNCGASNFLFRGMMENERFIDEFLERFKYHMNHSFEPSLILDKIDEYEKLFEPEMQEHIDRWAFPKNMELWHQYIDAMRDFAKKRPCYMRDHIMDYFNLTSFDYVCESKESVPFIYAKDNFAVYPKDPVTNQITVKCLSFESSKFNLDIYTQEGALISTHALEGELTQIDLSISPHVVYIIKIYDDEKSLYYKLIDSK